jgi:hypothetical protein
LIDNRLIQRRVTRPGRFHCDKIAGYLLGDAAVYHHGFEHLVPANAIIYLPRDQNITPFHALIAGVSIIEINIFWLRKIEKILWANRPNIGLVHSGVIMAGVGNFHLKTGA